MKNERETKESESKRKAKEIVMDVYERRNRIAELVHKKGRVTVKELGELFELSEVTVRADLSELEADGRIARVHGGAVPPYKSYYNMSLQQRMSSETENKQKIATHAARMIQEGDTVMLNSGTTTLLLLRSIHRNMNLTIVTNSVDIALEAGENPNFNVVMIGGTVNSKYHFSYGADANAQLSKYHADKLFLSVDGIDSENGFTTYYDLETDIDRRMLKNSASRIIVADASKIGRTAFACIAGLEEADHIITNSNAFKEKEFEKLQKSVKSVITV